ncbi:hypothetical protein IEO21_03496 [Rhodonia placenta]|uniref:Uncharacterized protein n=1 Tax=Rhodonia placenta TaxID=104341 RepID=A0A8H7U3V2_9APHY|nr:hypothetical protein IEO21_03496 [Postia placenta]
MNGPGEQFCEGCCSLCCIACTEACGTWLLFTKCCDNSDGHQAGCFGSCCKKSFDEDNFFADEEKRKREAAQNGLGAVNTQPSPRPSMSQISHNASNGNAGGQPARGPEVSPQDLGNGRIGTGKPDAPSNSAQ